MTIAAKVSPTELTDQVTSRFVGRYLEARLINAPGVPYVPGTTDEAVFLGFEVSEGLGGYARAVIKFNADDVLAYSDAGVALGTKATIFAQDGSATAIDFSHVALVWSGGNVTGLNTPSAAPDSGVDGTYLSVPFDSVASGTGSGLKVDIAVSNGGATPADWVITPSSPGTGFFVDEVLTINNGTLAGIGATTGSGDLVFSVAATDVNPDNGNILAVAQTSSAARLAGGNEAVFYWNLKQFGFYSVAS